MASSRADGLAEALFELKRAGKVATFSQLARRCGFGAGNNGRTIQSTLKTVRRDWPHLHWWRAVKDDGLLDDDPEQAVKLKEVGIELEITKKGNRIIATTLEAHLMLWELPPTEPVAAPVATK